ncbi:MAG: hypothetical protein HUU17_03325 [Chthonomonadales bacterium]|nr:hypothetical protein [Chthonomonadales bacterium]
MAQLALILRPHLAQGIVVEGLTNIAELFPSPVHVDPRNVATFLDVHDTDDRQVLMRDVYERVAARLEAL